MHRPEPIDAQKLRDAARILTVGLDHHCRKRRLHVPRLEHHHLKPGCDQTGIQPLRQRSRFEPDPRHSGLQPTEKPNQASGSLATFASRTILPAPSTTHTLLCSNDTSIPANTP
jgi:hypothetical protein